MSEEKPSGVEMYEEVIAIYEKGRKRATTPQDIAYLDEELRRLNLHLHRLKTNHAECIEACCPACTQGGLALTAERSQDF